MFTVLTALCEGTPFGDALASVAIGEQRVTRWFAAWSADGLFVRGHDFPYTEYKTP